MEIGVLGGAGVAGAAAASELRSRGHGVRVLSRRSGFDVTAAERGAALLEGLDGLVDCLNPAQTTTKAARAVLVDGLRETLQGAAGQGVRHVVSLSIVGIDHMPVGYYRVKVEQEGVVRDAPVPGTVVRATQFPALFDQAWSATKRAGVIPAPRGPVAPIDPRDVAIALADAVEAGPGGPKRVAIRGPEILDLREVAADWKRARGSRRPILPLPAIGAMLGAIADGDLVDEQLPTGRRGWSSWLAEEGTSTRTTTTKTTATP